MGRTFHATRRVPAERTLAFEVYLLIGAGQGFLVGKTGHCNEVAPKEEALESPETQILRVRLYALERRLRVMATAWTASLVLVVVVGIIVQQAASQSSVLRVRALEVVDESGRSRISLSTLRGWPEITVLDTAGHSRIGLSMDPGESTAVLSLAGRDPRNRLVLMPRGLTIGGMAGDQVSLTIQGLKRFVFGGCGNCPDKTIWSVP